MKDLILGLLFTALGIAVIVMARSFNAVSGMQYGANLFPTLIGIGMFGGGIALCVDAMRQLSRAHALGEQAARLPWPSPAVLLPVLVVIGYILLADVLGTAACLTLGMFVMLCTRGVRLLPGALLSGAAALLITFAFTRLLAVPLPLGPLGF